jgi:hypothetical protein
MKRILASLAIGAVALLLWTADARTDTPEPSPVPVSWQLDIELDNPQAVEIIIDGKPRTFWYLRYTVINGSGEDQVFIPDFLLYTDTGQMLRASKNVPANVFEEIKKQLKDPLLKDNIEVAGRLLQGEDNAKSSLAIWPDFDGQSGSFSVFAGGLSGETTEVKLPSPITVTHTNVKGEQVTEQRDAVVLSKTLELIYSIPGEAKARARTTVKLLDKVWIMR